MQTTLKRRILIYLPEYITLVISQKTLCKMFNWILSSKSKLLIDGILLISWLIKTKVFRFD